jgi:2-polyprenyl-3-methyl-5-hydroxy-6-metoxy-1,4-benzoquinol methylase
LKGWFSIAGVQKGKYDLKDRIANLGTMRPRASGVTILDLGCAEGLIGKWLVDSSGANTLHGLDLHEPYIEMAQSLMRDYDARFLHADFDHFETWLDVNREALLPQYDIVMALRVVQKLAKPDRFLSLIKPLVKKWFVIHVPTNPIDDARSGHKTVDITEVLKPEFKLIEYKDGAEFCGIYERRA